MEKTVKQMRPYSLYLPEDMINKLKDMAKNRKSASFVRDAISAALETKGEYHAGYCAAIRDAQKIVDDCRELDIIYVKGKPLAYQLVFDMGNLTNDD